MKNSELFKLLASASTKDSTLLDDSMNDNDDKFLSEQLKEPQRSNKNIEKKLDFVDLKSSLEKDFDDNDEPKIPTDAVIDEEETNFMLRASDGDEIPKKLSNDVFMTPEKGKYKLEGPKSWKELVYSYKVDKVKEVNMAPMKAKKGLRKAKEDIRKQKVHKRKLRSMKQGTVRSHGPIVRPHVSLGAFWDAFCLYPRDCTVSPYNTLANSTSGSC
ncbi:hypothetical protein PIB30_077166 [Stylosanthes scabra]|uniref:Uncharacterized protein n=1 Tax=Stylosanthes scabra TaxID=79078 RepID=A0ABU6XT07_9FABA|nr:hypothetical protein [Stylosanthes scabra]